MSLFLVFASCSGEEFESGTGGTGGTAGADGSAGNAFVCSMGDASATDTADCTSELYCKNCNQVTTAVGTCDECARSRCCAEAAECMANIACARLMACYFRNCKYQSASVCIFDPPCNECLQDSLGLFVKLAACIQNNCKTAPDPCPQLVE